MDNSETQKRVIKADKKARVLAVLVCIVWACVGAALIEWVLPWGQDQLERAEPGQASGVMQFLIGFIFLSIIPFAAYLFWFGFRAVRHRQVPPPGTRVIRDTKLLEGDKAVTRGRLVMGMALLLTALGLLGGLYLPYRIGKAFRDQIRQTSPQREQPETRRVGLVPP